MPPSPPPESKAECEAVSLAHQRSRAKRDELQQKNKNRGKLQTGTIKEREQARGAFVSVSDAREEPISEQNGSAAQRAGTKLPGLGVLVPAIADAQKGTIRVQAAAFGHPVTQSAKVPTPTRHSRTLSAIQQTLESHHETSGEGPNANRGVQAIPFDLRRQQPVFPAREIYDRCHFRPPGQSDATAGSSKAAIAKGQTGEMHESHATHSSVSRALTNLSAVLVGPTISSPLTDLSRVLVGATLTGGLPDQQSYEMNASKTATDRELAAEREVVHARTAAAGSGLPPSPPSPSTNPDLQAPPAAQCLFYGSNTPSSDDLDRTPEPSMQRTSNAYEVSANDIGYQDETTRSLDELESVTPDASQPKTSTGAVNAPVAPLTTLRDKTNHGYGAKSSSRGLRRLSKCEQVAAPQPGQGQGHSYAAHINSADENANGGQSEMSPKRRKL